MSDWRSVTWGDVIELKYGRSLVGGSVGAGHVRVFGTNGPTGYTDVAPQGRGPTVVVGRKGAYRGVHYSTGPFFVIDTAYFVAPRVSLDMRWCYYALKGVDIQGLATGSAIPSTRREDLYVLPLRLPSITTQESISEVLGALDDKISANERLAASALELASARVEEACVHSSTRELLGDIAHFRNRERIPLSKNERAERPGVVPYYGATGVVDFVDQSLFHEPLVLVGEDGTVVKNSGKPVVQYVWGPTWVNNHAHVLTGVGVSNSLLRHILARSNVAGRVTGAVQLKLSMGNLRLVAVDVPSSDELLTLERRVEALTSREMAAIDENKRLVATREELLPLLMSGRITVKDAEKAVEEVV